MSLSKITYQMWYNHPSSLQIETTKRVGSGEWFLLGVQGHQAMKACMSRQFLTTIIYSDHHQKNQALLEIPNNSIFEFSIFKLYLWISGTYLVPVLTP